MKKNIVSYIAFSFAIVLSMIILKQNQLDMINNSWYTSDFFFLELQRGGLNILYPMVVIIFFPLLMGSTNQNISSSRFDRLIITRIGLQKFYKKYYIISFFKGVAFGVILNLFVVTAIGLIVHPFFSYKLNSSTLLNTNFWNDNALINMLFYIIYQSIGFGIVSIYLFLISRLRTKKFIFNFSLLVIIVLTTSFASIFAEILSVFSVSYNTISGILKIIASISPLNLMFPTYFETFSTVFQNYPHLQFMTTLLLYLTVLGVVIETTKNNKRVLYES